MMIKLMTLPLLIYLHCRLPTLPQYIGRKPVVSRFEHLGACFVLMTSRSTGTIFSQSNCSITDHCQTAEGRLSCLESQQDAEDWKDEIDEYLECAYITVKLNPWPMTHGASVLCSDLLMSLYGLIKASPNKSRLENKRLLLRSWAEFWNSSTEVKHPNRQPTNLYWPPL